MIKLGKEPEVIEIKLSKDKYPIAYNNKLEELIGLGVSKEEAEKWIDDSVFVMELIYEKDAGLFAIESDAIESSIETLCSPYTKENIEEEY